MVVETLIKRDTTHRRGFRRLDLLLLSRYAVLAIWSIMFLAPMAWLISTSLKATGQEFAYPPEWIPNPAVWRNYIEIFDTLPFDLFFLNTMAIVIAAGIGTVLTSSVVGFSFCRLHYPGRDFWFLVVLATMMLPDAVTLVPHYVIFRTLGWIDTLLPLIVPAWFGGGAFNIFLFRQFFATIPHEMDEAARIDGASTLRIYWQILMPLSKPVLATIAVFSIVGNWNNFMGPLIYLNSTKKMTLAVGLRLFRNQYTGYWNLMMAAGVLMTIPMLLLFMVAQRYFVKGIVMTGIAGR